MRKSIQRASIANGITGVGDRKVMVTHGLRGTVSTLLLEAGLFDTATSLKTGHLNNKCLKSYKALHEKRENSTENYLCI